MDARIALLVQKTTYLVFRKVGRHLNRKGHNQSGIARFGRAFTDRSQNRGGRIAANWLTAAPANQLGAPREQQLQVVVQFGHRPNRAARAAHRIGLVDCDRRQNALYFVDQRLIHTIQKLARIGRKRFHIASLPLGIERIEREGAFTRAADACHDGQLPRVQGQIEVF